MLLLDDDNKMESFISNPMFCLYSYMHRYLSLTLVRSFHVTVDVNVFYWSLTHLFHRHRS